jgi:zinc transport system permease protein
LLGVALSFAFSLSPVIGVLIAALGMALLVSTLSGRSFAADTLLGVAAHAALAFGLVGLSLTSGRTIDVEAYLFGEILAVSTNDLGLIWGGAAVILLLLAFCWRALLTSTLNPDLAYADGIDPRRAQLVLIVAVAVVVAVALKVVGALLITAMLIIPAATARSFARTPEVMAVLAALFGITAAIGGLEVSWLADTPTSPTIVAIAAILFVATLIGSAVWRLISERLT